MKTFTIDLPSRYFVNAESPREARDFILKKLKGADPSIFCNAKFTDHEGKVTLLDSTDSGLTCCLRPRN